MYAHVTVVPLIHLNRAELFLENLNVHWIKFRYQLKVIGSQSIVVANNDGFYKFINVPVGRQSFLSQTCLAMLQPNERAK